MGEKWEPKSVRETEPCSFPDAENIIREFYALRSKKREGTFEELRINDLLKAHVLEERCPHCLLLIKQLSEEEKIREEKGRY